jgi:chaperonin GroES
VAFLPHEKGRTMEIVPLYDKVLVRKDKTEEVTEGGIHVPITAVKEQVLANVVAVGEGRLLSSGNTIPPKVEVGDKVILGKFSGTSVEFNDEKLLLIREDDILAVVRSE